MIAGMIPETGHMRGLHRKVMQICPDIADWREKNHSKQSPATEQHCAGEIPCANLREGGPWAAVSCKPEHRGRLALTATVKTIRSVGCPTALKPFSPFLW